MEGAYYTFEKKSVLIVPLGDIQWAGKSDTVAITSLQKFVLEALARETDEMEVVFLGYGDYIDYKSPSNRAKYKAANLHDTAQEVDEDTAVRLSQELLNLVLRPTVGKWLGLVSGHHYSDLLSGGTSDTWLCERLKARHLGDCANIRLAFRPSKGSGSSTVDIWVHHGAGAGQTEWAPLQRLQKMMAKDDADIFIQGHLHKECTAKTAKTYPTYDHKGEFKQRHRIVRLVGCGGWLKGYVEGRKAAGRAQGTYVEKAMLSPVSFGAPLIRIHPEWDQSVDRSLGRRLNAPGFRQNKIWTPRIIVET